MGRDIKQLHPRLQQKIAELKQMCSGEGLILGIGECFRSVAEQDALYAQGRTAPGSVVTNAPGSSYSSQHQWGIAFDFFKNVSGHAYDDIAFFDRVGALGKSIGLGWGGDWTSPVDKPHLYLPDWGSTPARLKQQYGTFEAFRSTWSAGGTSGGSSGSAGGSSSGSASSASAYSFQTPTIRLGSTGIAVLLLQEILLPRGFYRGTLDRSFGNQTREAVRSYQISRNGASGAADGIVGSTTSVSYTHLANCRLPVLQKYGCSPSNSLAVPVVAAYIHNMLRRGCNLQEAVRALKPYPAQSRKKTDDGIPFAEKEREVPVVLLVDGDVRRGTLFCEIILDQLLEKYGIEATALTSEMSERYDIRVRVFLSTLQIADDVYFMQTHYKTDLIFIVADVYEYSDICRRLESDLKVFIEDRRVKMTTDESSVILGREQVADAIYYALT